MEELSIEEKAKAYDEAIERSKNYYSTTDSASDIKLIGLIFPELKESEGERIRKELIEFVKSRGGFKQEYIAWLEKQGNLMKALQISNARIGELVEKNYYLREQLEKRGNNMGISEATKQELEENLNKALEQETPESWNKFLDEQGEQKPVEEYNITGIGSKNATGKLGEMIKKKLEMEKQGEQNLANSAKTCKDEQNPNPCDGCVNRKGCINCENGELREVEQKPAVEMKTPEESLGIDSDTYNKIVDECIYGEQKPADKIESRQEELTEFEKAVKQVMEEAIECGDTHNLKADADMLLRLVQKSSWSEEDEKILNLIIARLHSHPNVEAEEYGKDYHWLKFLKERYTWKPSSEQVKALQTAIGIVGELTPTASLLKEIREQLKKLKG